MGAALSRARVLVESRPHPPKITRLLTRGSLSGSDAILLMISSGSGSADDLPVRVLALDAAVRRQVEQVAASDPDALPAGRRAGEQPA